MNDYFEYSDFSGKSAIPSRLQGFRRAFKVCCLSFLAGFVVVSIFLGLWLKDIGLFDLDTGQIKTLTEFRSPDSTRIYDANDHLLTLVYRNQHLFLPYGKTPLNLRNAIIAAEDKRFFQHSGFDYLAIGRVLVDAVKSKKLFKQGASTISQQVVRKMILSNEKTLTRKVKEMYLAWQLERQMSKQKIFEIYANNMFLGSGSYGVGAAALRYFGKSPSKLSLKESAIIAGLFQLPSALSPFQNPEGAELRAAYVLGRMVALDMIDDEQYQAALAEKPKYVPYLQGQRNQAPYFIDHVLSEIEAKVKSWDKDDGLRVYTTFDPAIQVMMDQTLKASEPILQHFDKSVYSSKPGQAASLQGQVAMVAMRPKTGEIVAMIGGRDYGVSQFNRAVQAKRSPGSAFKPFVYAQALSMGFKWSDLFFVSPIDIEGYRPRDMAAQYLRETTMLKAFYKSLNTPTIELGMKLGVDKVIEMAKNMGIESPLKQEAGTLIGSSEVTLLEMARAYSVIANGGVRSEPAVIRKITDHRGQVLWEQQSLEKTQVRVLDEKVSYLMIEGMRNVLRFGTASAASYMADRVVGKTGTGDQSIDNWFCGFTEDLVVIVWTGTDENLPVFGNISGGTVALPIWKQFMDRYIAKYKPENFRRPDGLVELNIDPDFGVVNEKGVPAWFLNGQLPSSNSAKALSILKQQGRYRSAFSH